MCMSLIVALSVFAGLPSVTSRSTSSTSHMEEEKIAVSTPVMPNPVWDNDMFCLGWNFLKEFIVVY